MSDDMIQKRINELQTEGSKWLKENFNLSLDIAIISNNHFSKTLGRMVIQKNEPRYIEIAEDVLYGDIQVAWNVLRHELVHYALYSQGLPFKDADQEFIDTCEELNVPLTGDIHIQRKRVIMECNKCNMEFIRHRKDNNLMHADCGGGLVFKEYRII